MLFPFFTIVFSFPAQKSETTLSTVNNGSRKVATNPVGLNWNIVCQLEPNRCSEVERRRVKCDLMGKDDLYCLLCPGNKPDYHKLKVYPPEKAT